MGKNQSMSDMQDRILHQFSNAAKQSTVNTTIEQQIIDASIKKQELAKNAAKKAKPVEEEVRISYYNPNNPLNGFNLKSKCDQQKILEKIKSDAKEEKHTKEDK
ncbi:hypothetical protein M0Q50_09245 [bacterium]|jgi:hypothetical protein|nr:hypothetical protein [bacterium]